MIALRKKCAARGILLPKKISKGGIADLLKCETLLIGIEPEKAGLPSKVRVISTRTPSENLKWVSLTMKKGIPGEKFSQIYIGNPELLLTSSGDVNPRPYHAISRVLKRDGLIYLVPGGEYCGGLMERMGRDFKFTEFHSPPTSSVTFAVYIRRGYPAGTPTGIPPKDLIRAKSVLGKYRLVDLDLAVDPNPSLHITLNEFTKEVERPEFINQFASSVKNLLLYKKGFYLKKKGEVKIKFDALQRKIKHVKSMGVDSSTVKDMYPMYEFYVGFLFELEETIAQINCLHKRLTPENIKKGLLKAIHDPIRGLESLIGRIKIKDQLISQLYAFSQNWKVFVGNFCNFALMGSSGVGKCLGPDEKVILFDGTLKKARDIKVGDFLMGDDSTKRRVLSICSGEDEMFRIVPTRGEPFIVNAPHVLTLVLSPRITKDLKRGRYRVVWMENGKQKSKTFKGLGEESERKAEEFLKSLPISPDIIDISLDEYMKKSSSWKTLYKGFRVGVEWAHKNIPLDPYLLGVWLGNGSSYDPSIANADKEVVDEVFSICEKMGLKVAPGKNNPITYRISKGTSPVNTFRLVLKELNLFRNKHIPEIYKINDRWVRLELLAGLIDSDGYLVHNCYEIFQKSKVLIDDIVFLARSLGFYVSMKPCQKTGTNGSTGTYFRAVISGENLRDIPVRITRKRAAPRRQIKNGQRFGFKIEPLGRGKYCGFTLDGNGRFLLEDFTVTHNTRLGQVISFVFAKSGILATDTIHIVSRSDLVGQYIGQTAPRTRSLLLASLEGVLFIDEAYQLAGCDRDFGREAITEMVNFLDKYVGMSVVIVAGYQGLMQEKFFPSNEGLDRRFPHQIVLEPYSVSQLADILVNFVDRALPFDLETSTKNLLFTLLSRVQQDLPKAFDKQAGDMLNLGGNILTAIYSSYKVKWGNSLDNSQILISAFVKFLQTKGYPEYNFRSQRQC